MESLSLSQLPHYNVDGALHLIVNNQIGYTTQSEAARSTTWCSDIAKGVDIPIIHVNADEPEVVNDNSIFLCRVLLEWWKLRSNTVIGLERYSHNFSLIWFCRM